MTKLFIFIFQQKPICQTSKAYETRQISDTNSTSKSDYSESTFSNLAKSEQFVNIQQKFSHFNPETTNPHYAEFEQSDSNTPCVEESNNVNRVCVNNHNRFIMSLSSQNLPNISSDQLSDRSCACSINNERKTSEHYYPTNLEPKSSSARLTHI